MTYSTFAYPPGSGGGGGSGTVTTVSVVSTNGLGGTVANATTTPAITLSTSITGVLKGNGTAISAATIGTDYVTASSTNTFTNKTYDTAATGNSLSINGLATTDNTGTGAVVRATDPVFTDRTYIPATGISTTNGEGYFIRNSSNIPLTTYQALDFAGFTFTFFAVNKIYLGSAWADSGLSRVGCSFQLTNDNFTFFSFDTGNTFTNRIALESGGHLNWNDSQAAAHAVFKGVGDAQVLYVDGTNSRVGIGTASPSTKLHVNGSITLTDGNNIITGTTTGMQIATGSTQKLGFYGTTPVVKPSNIPAATGTIASVQTTVNSVLTLLQSLGLMT